MANTIQILVETVDRTGGGFNAILSKLGLSNEKIKEINNKLPEMAAKFALVSAAIGAVVKFTKEAVDETIKYGDAMNDLSLATGQPAEDMSRLAGAAERFGVDYKTLMSGLGSATKKGVDTSIDSLLNLADQYNAIKDPIQQAKFMTEIFGASGPEMARIFRRGSDDIVAAMGDVSKSLVWDSEKQKTIDDYQYALEDLKQSFSALKVEVGLAVMPSITNFLNLLNGNTSVKTFADDNQLLADKFSGLAGTAGSAIPQIQGVNTELEKTPGVANPAAGALGNVGANVPDLSGLKTGLSSVTSLFKELTKEMLFNIASQGLTADEAFALASNMGLINYKTAWANEEIKRFSERLANDDITIQEYNDLVVALWTNMEKITDKEATITIHGNITKEAREALGYMGGSSSGRLMDRTGDVIQEARAVGGAVAPNVPYLVGENGPEIFKPNAAGTIIPNGQVGGYSGGGEVDYDRMARAFIEALERSSLVR